MEAGQLAGQAEREPLRELIHNTLADSALSDAAKIARFRSEVPTLPEQSEQAITDQIRSRYPNLSDAECLAVQASIRDSVQTQTQIVLQSLKEFEEASAESSVVQTLTQWLSHRGIGN